MDIEKKKHHLKHPRIEIDARKRTVGDLLEGMTKTAFQGRKLGEALSVWKKMLSNDKTVIFMGLSGAMVPAGMGKLVSYLIKERCIDVLVTTGATLSHDLYQVLGAEHFMGTYQVDDSELERLRIDRIYDVYADEDGFYKADLWIIDRLPELLEDDRPYSTREIAKVIGKEATDKEHDGTSILATAYRAGVPIFVPAFGDSSMGFALMMANRRRKRRIIVDMMRDVDQICQITEANEKTGVVLIGGGVPKNYIQQTAVVAGYETQKEMMHDYGISITTDSPQWGGLSGCTFDESKSWGKYVKEAVTATCYCDATIALPMLVSGLAEWDGRRSRMVPNFTWNKSKVKVEFTER